MILWFYEGLQGGGVLGLNVEAAAGHNRRPRGDVLRGIRGHGGHVSHLRTLCPWRSDVAWTWAAGLCTRSVLCEHKQSTQPRGPLTGAASRTGVGQPRLAARRPPNKPLSHSPSSSCSGRVDTASVMRHWHSSDIQYRKNVTERGFCCFVFFFFVANWKLIFDEMMTGRIIQAWV